MNKGKSNQLRRSVAPYEKSNTTSSMRQLFNTIPPFFLLWVFAYQSLTISIWLTIPLAIVAAGFLVRSFIIFHDCTHNSFLNSKKANNILGTLLGILTLFPYEKWKREHAIHHATNSNLDKRGTGDIWVMTIEEYAAASFWQRLAYRMYRNPFVMFGLGPFFLFLVSNRMNRKDAKRKEQLNTHIINVSIVAIYALLVWLIGWQPFLIIQGTILFISGSLGIWLFYVQHQFEDSYFENKDEWNYVKAAIDGSSYYKLSKVLQWLTGNIGYHHVHHLSPRVPNYNLEKVHNTSPLLQQVTTITLWSSLKSIRFRLYDEKNKKFVSFKEVKHLLNRQRKSIQLASGKTSFQGNK
ncbi:fatty acid desaturase [Pueribacillus theae]|uniref:Fatty acid desaturase n=1 Tax=Pueribacillus theae TaxID=2171751 RepID=A0A2U1K4U7_9BACI|nr:fatty acid desaturase [Pueribacillus theae]PWA11978.1 fatty acid desaturase [Pueribacillus theae]